MSIIIDPCFITPAPSRFLRLPLALGAHQEVRIATRALSCYCICLSTQGNLYAVTADCARTPVADLHICADMDRGASFCRAQLTPEFQRPGRRPDRTAVWRGIYRFTLVNTFYLRITASCNARWSADKVLQRCCSKSEQASSAQIQPRTWSTQRTCHNRGFTLFGAVISFANPNMPARHAVLPPHRDTELQYRSLRFYHRSFAPSQRAAQVGAGL